MQELSKEDLEAAETTGFPIVLLILLVVFGSLAAASLPLALGFGSVLVSGAGVYFLSQATEMSVFVTNVASMIGIGVAVDYSLFVLARYREEIREGRSREDALKVSMRTSGLAVVFSGVTVIVSLAGLFLVDSTVIQSMAMGAIMVVAIAILAAVTLAAGADLALRAPRVRAQPDHDRRRARRAPVAEPPPARRLDASRPPPRQLLGPLDRCRDAAAVAVGRA